MKLSADEQLSSLKKSSTIQITDSSPTRDNESSVFPEIKDNSLRSNLLGLPKLNSMKNYNGRYLNIFKWYMCMYI